MEILKIVLSSATVATIIQQLFQICGNRNKVDRLLLLDALKRQGLEYLAAGEITTTDLACFLEYYDFYKKKGGDGFADALKAKVVALPLKVEA